MNQVSLPADHDLLVIGRIVGAFGWAGELRVRPETDFPDRFLRLHEIWLELPDKKLRKCQVERVRVTGDRVHLKLAEYTNKEEAVTLYGCLILVPSPEAVSLPDGHYFIHQIIGVSVRTTEGRELGEVIEVIQAPAHDVYVTPIAKIPARKEIVKEINIEQGIMIVEAWAVLIE